MQLEFFGAAGEVTGSCHILRAGGRQLLLDCGMIQGGADAPLRNRQAFPFDAAGVDAVVLSHAHIDHCGRLPLLVKRGFRGPIHTNPACADLLPILLRDSAHLLMRESERAGRGAVGAAAESALFDLEDVEAVMRQVEVLAYDTPREVLPGFAVQVREAGHILGSSSVELRVTEGEVRRKLVFSGDLGQYDTPILHDPYRFESADLVLMESTYGDRRHRGREDTERELGSILAQAARDGGNIIVPAFAIGRSQELLYLLAKHYGEWHVARWKIFLDSPMAIAASRVYWKHPERFDDEASRLRASFRGMPPLPNLVLSETAGRLARHQQHPRRRAHHRGLRHGQWRPRAASPQTQPAAARMPRADRRIPGAGHAWPPARRSPAGSAHPRRSGAGGGSGAYRGRAVRPWRPGATFALV